MKPKQSISHDLYQLATKNMHQKLNSNWDDKNLNIAVHMNNIDDEINRYQIYLHTEILLHNIKILLYVVR
jgi:hypothetical protein